VASTGIVCLAIWMVCEASDGGNPMLPGLDAVIVQLPAPVMCAVELLVVQLPVAEKVIGAPFASAVSGKSASPYVSSGIGSNVIPCVTEANVMVMLAPLVEFAPAVFTWFVPTLKELPPPPPAPPALPRPRV
jgi:hypothetical protein